MGTAIDAAIWWVGLFGGCNYFIIVVVVIIMFTFHFCIFVSGCATKRTGGCKR